MSDFKLEPCPARRDVTAGYHCWHRHGMHTYTSNPSQHDEKCCHCGEVKRVVDWPSATINNPGHGPHAPKTLLYNTLGATRDP